MESNNNNPHTPRSGKELMKVLDSLNNKFFLELPNPLYSSPSTRLTESSRIDVQCVIIIRYLFYAAGQKLDRLIIDFEEWSQPRLSQWLWKQQQEPGTLPTRSNFIQRDVPTGTGKITETERMELLRHLRGLLDDEYYLVRGKRPSFTRDNTASSNHRAFNAFDGEDSSSTRRTLFPRKDNNGNGSTTPATNSPSFKPSTTATPSNFSGTGKRKSSEDQEVFTTAPNSPISTTSPIPDEFLDEFEDFDLDDLDLDSITKADVDVGDQRTKPTKKKQSRIDSYMATFSSKDTGSVQTQVNKSMVSASEGTTFSTIPPSGIFSRNESTLGVSFGSENTDVTEPIDEITSTQESSTREFWDNEEVRTSLDAACRGAEQLVPFPSTGSTGDAIIAELSKHGPFAKKNITTSKIPLRYRYELERVASSWNLPMEKVQVGAPVLSSESSHSDFWAWVRNHGLRAGKPLPEKPSIRAWNHAVEQYRDTGKNAPGKNGDVVTLSGELNWCEKAEPGYLKLNLKPMKLERSCRFYRRFGSDRFLALTIPNPSQTPRYLIPSSDPLSLQHSVAKWLAATEHHCLGRVWRAFYLEEVKYKASTKEKEKAEMKMKVHLFAVDGIDFLGTSPDQHEIAPEAQVSEKRTPMSLLSLINWHMSLDANINQSDCKLFQRFSLGLSKTLPSVALQTHEIFRLEDPPPEKKVMNDGCARMSKSLAIHIAEALDIGGITPSCFQGRIAGAKGVWMVDRDDTAFKAGDRGFWIQISDSQLKIKPHPAEMIGYVDPEKLTFEVVNWSKPLNAVDLNIQLLTILEHRGVRKSYLESLIRQQIKSLYDEFVEIFGTGNRLGCRRIVQKLRPPGDDSARKKTRRIGEWPMDETEQIIYLLESGFEPLTCQYLSNLLRSCLKSFLDRYVDRLQIRVPLSTYAYCIADPFGVLKEDEVFFGLSQAWDDPSFNDTVFDGIDILVGRLPAHYPFDIQKRRAVWKKELRHYKDVVVFSTQGNTPLAHMLSGGDYDGDTPWICWDPEIVSAFENAEFRENMHSEKEYGLVDHSKLMREVGSVDEFVFKAFKFNFKPSLLGTCTVELEKLSYDTSIDSGAAIYLSGLVSYLVDSRKAGRELTQDKWKSIRKTVSSIPREMPAYKSWDGRNWKKTSIIDYLKFKVAEDERNKVLSEFAKVHNKNVDVRKDEDLTCIWNQTYQRAEAEIGRPELLQCLKDLRNSIKSTQAAWVKANVIDKTSFAENVQAATDSIQNIKAPNFDHPLSYVWQHSEYEWDRVRASCLYKHYGQGGSKFPWYSVGETLCRIKAEANSPTRMLTEDIYLAHRLDSKRAKRIEARASAEGEEDVSEEEDFFENDDVFLDADYYLGLENGTV